MLRALNEQLRNRNFQGAFERALKIIDTTAPAASDDDRAAAEITLGRIYFEFGHRERAAQWLMAGVERLKGLDNPAFGLDPQWLAALACWARSRTDDDANPDEESKLEPDQREWLRRMRCTSNVPPTFDPAESWELLLAGARHHRILCRQRSGDDNTAVRAKAYVAALRQKAADTPSAAQVHDRLLSIVPVEVDVHYQWAGVLFDVGDLIEAEVEFQALACRPQGAGHVACRLALVQTARSLGISSSDRRRRIEETLKAISCGFDATDREPGVPAHNSPTRWLDYDDAQHVLARQMALTHSRTDPETAFEICAEADATWAREGPCTIARLRYATKANFPLSKLADELRTLLTSHGIGAELVELQNNDDELVRARLDTYLRNTAKAQVSSVFNPRMIDHNALLAVADTLRNLGQDSTALTIYERLAEEKNVSSLPVGRLMSLLSSLGRSDEAIALAEQTLNSEHGRQRPEALELELARAELNAGHFHEADKLFRALTNHSWVPVAVDAWVGRIDVARRRRDLAGAHQLAAQARSAQEWIAPDADTPRSVDVCADVGACAGAGAGSESGAGSGSGSTKGDEPTVFARDLGLDAELDIALGWAELHLGNPRCGLALLLGAVEALPYSISSWIGVIRCLRLLGRQGDALEVLRRLNEGAPNDTIDWWDLNPTSGQKQPPKPMRLISTRHAGRLHNERGWCYLDLDLTAESQTEFELTRDRSPNLAPPFRGLVSAMAATPTQVDTIANGLLEDTRTTQRSTDSLDGDIHIEAARLFITNHDDASALPHIQQLETILHHPKTSTATKRRILFNLADAYLEARRAPEATSLLDRIDQLLPSDNSGFPGDERPAIFRARCHMTNGHPEHALAVLNDWAATRNPDHLSEAFRIAQLVATFEKRDFDEAGDLVNGLAPDPVDPFAGERTSSWFERVPESDVKVLLQVWIALAKSELPPRDPSCEKRLIADAAELLTGLHTDSVDSMHIRAVVAAREASLGNVGEGSYNAASRTIDRALRRRPNDASLLRDKGAILIGMGQYREAITTLEEAKRKGPTDARTFLLTGTAQDAMGQRVLALESFRRAVALDPNDYVHHRALAATLLDTGNFEGALEAVQFGMQVVTSNRSRELELLHTRIIAERAETLDRRTRTIELERAERLLGELERKYEDTQNRPVAQVEVATRKALLAGRRGQYPQARELLAEAKKKGVRSDEIEHLERQIPKPRAWLQQPEYVALTLTVLVTTMLVGAIAYDIVNQSNPVGLAESATAIVGVAAIPLAIVLVPRLTRLTFHNMTIELSPKTPLQETVHVDLDLSASDLLRIGGFSNHRPSLPFDDVEPRVVNF